MLTQELVEQWFVAGRSAEGKRVQTQLGRALVIEDGMNEYLVALYSTKERILVPKIELESLNLETDIFRFRAFFRQNNEIAHALDQAHPLPTRIELIKKKEEFGKIIPLVHSRKDGW